MDVTYEILDVEHLADDDPLRCRCPAQKWWTPDFFPILPFGCPNRATAEDGLCDECRGEEGSHVTIRPWKNEGSS
jgi:hypothetical protein